MADKPKKPKSIGGLESLGQAFGRPEPLKPEEPKVAVEGGPVPPRYELTDRREKREWKGEFFDDQPREFDDQDFFNPDFTLERKPFDPDAPRLDKQFQKDLKRAEGEAFAAQMQTIVKVIQDSSEQREKDRGSYLVIENAHRLSPTEQADIFTATFSANKRPARGVIEAVINAIPKFATEAIPAIAMIREIPPPVAVQAIGKVDEAQRPEVAARVVANLMNSKQYSVAAAVAEKFVPEKLEEVCIAAFGHAEAMLANEETRALTSRGREEFFSVISRAVDAALKHNLKEPIEYLRKSETLKKGERFYAFRMLRAARLIGDVEWQKKVLPAATEALSHPDTSPASAKIVFEAMRGLSIEPDRLWAVITRDHVAKLRHMEFLPFLAEMAMTTARGDWMEQVFAAASQELNGDTGYARQGYEALEILAPTHAAAKKIVESRPKPEYRMVLR